MLKRKSFLIVIKAIWSIFFFSAVCLDSNHSKVVKLSKKQLQIVQFLLNNYKKYSLLTNEYHKIITCTLMLYQNRMIFCLPQNTKGELFHAIIINRAFKLQKGCKSTIKLVNATYFKSADTKR